jgi:Xaa-Pro aminopeptidase
MSRSLQTPESRPGSKRAARAAKLTEAPHAQRLARLAAAVRESPAELAGVLITNPKDVGYLTGFLGGDSYLLVPADCGISRSAVPTLISDFRYKEELEPVEQAATAKVYIRSRSMTEAVAEVLTSFFGQVGGPPGSADARVGIQADHMTIAEKATLSRKLGAGGSKKLADTVGLVSKLRVIKDEFEVGLIRKAARIQEAALEAVLPTIKAGQTELEVAARLEAEMKTRGSSEPGFQTIVAAGPNGSLPHYRPGPKKLAAGKPVLIDWGAVYRGYHSDMTRTFSLGKWPPKVRDIYTIVLEAQMAAADGLGPGKSSVEIDAIARKHITKQGFGEFFGHGLGHGIGLNGHEEPRLTNMLAPTKLEVGMVVTVEPGIYLPGIGGVRIEDDYVITEEGAENLCGLKKDLDWSTLG